MAAEWTKELMTGKGQCETLEDNAEDVVSDGRCGMKMRPPV